MSTKKRKIDFKSIRFKLWIYFIGFAVLLMVLIWLLQIYFLENYYAGMKEQEATNIANRIVEEFEGNPNSSELRKQIDDITSVNDVYIRVETGSGIPVLMDGNKSDYTSILLYNAQTEVMREKLKASPFTKVTATFTEDTGDKENNMRTLALACYLTKPASTGDDSEVFENSFILYLYSPLYPVQSTVTILRVQLIYITLIAALLAFSLALYLANRISRPIKNITRSAAEMGKGNYGVQFERGHYTEITELANTLTDASRELEKTEMYQKDLIANVSHDLRTPLTMIKSYAEMIRDLSGNNPKKREEHLNVIIDEADRLNTLVNDMLSMSRMQSRKMVLEMTTFDICETAATLLSSYDILKEQEGYKFTFRRPADALTVNADAAKIKQVLSNLINNAVKYCGEDKEIIITVKKSGRKVRCEVSDHGPGIAPDEINHVWERYYKSSTHHVRPTDGSGLGLSIVKEILTLHKADYGVNSKVGKGSTFWFELELMKK